MNAPFHDEFAAFELERNGVIPFTDAQLTGLTRDREMQDALRERVKSVRHVTITPLPLAVRCLAMLASPKGAATLTALSLLYMAWEFAR